VAESGLWAAVLCGLDAPDAIIWNRREKEKVANVSAHETRPKVRV